MCARAIVAVLGSRRPSLIKRPGNPSLQLLVSQALHRGPHGARYLFGLQFAVVCGGRKRKGKPKC